MKKLNERSIYILVMSAMKVIFNLLSGISDLLSNITVLSTAMSKICQFINDLINFKSQQLLQEQRQLYNLGVSSDAAQKQSAKRAEFCEKYIIEVHRTEETLEWHGDTATLSLHVLDLRKIRSAYAIFITSELSAYLNRFEDGVARAAAKTLKTESKKCDSDAIEDRNSTAMQILGMYGGDISVEQREISIQDVEARLRDFLQTDDLVEIRTKVVKDSLS